MAHSIEHAGAWPRAALATLALVVLASASFGARADPPGRAARLSYVSGDAAFSPAGSDDWIVARINRPLWIGDRLWSANGNIELQIGGASLRLAPRTAITVLNFDDRIAQFEVTEGNVALHVRTIDTRDETIELATPTLAFVVRTEGDYRLDVGRDSTAVGVRRGWAEVWGAGSAFRIDRREQFVFYDADLRDYDVVALPPADGFERWARDRARREDASVSARYVAPELVGYVDLDPYGEWREERDIGAVWYPRVATGWAPYRYGHWTWVDPWGWTWVDDAPWGFAPFHYGRWTRLAGRWGWVPGPRDVRPVYSPALVAWVGGDGFSLSMSSGPTRGVAWFPLAPGEIWRPSYDVSREYFTRVNVSNTHITQTTVVNVYNDFRGGGRSRVDYRHRAAPAAITAVPVDAFVESRPVHRNAVNVSQNVVDNVIRQAPVTTAPAVRPVVRSFVGPAPQAQTRPPAEAYRRQVVAREAPPVAVPSLAERANMVRERGRPIDRQALEQARPAATTATPQAPSSGTARAPGQRPPAAQQRSPNELRAGVRVVGGDATAQPAAPLPPSTRAAEAAGAPRAPVRSAPPAASRAAEEAARPKGNETRREAPERGRVDERDGNAAARGATRGAAEPSAAAPTSPEAAGSTRRDDTGPPQRARGPEDRDRSPSPRGREAGTPTPPQGLPSRETNDRSPPAPAAAAPARPEATPSSRAAEAPDGGPRGNARDERRGNGRDQRAAPERPGPAAGGAAPQAMPTTRPDAGRPPSGPAKDESRRENDQRGQGGKSKGRQKGEDDEPGKDRGNGG